MTKDAPAVSHGPPVTPAGSTAETVSPAIQAHGLAKAYGTTQVLRSVSLAVPAGAITAVLGASGSGKTTLLRLIAGFEPADSGTIRITGHLVDDGHRSVRPQHRGIGYVPQDAALFPHLTTIGNIAFGMPRRHRSRLADLTELVGLAGLEKRYPHQLSGGQQQRVALARALAVNPQVVLLDEPFGSLDAALRESVRADVARILAEAGATTVLVTHDQDEALSLASHIALLGNGQITAYGSPRNLYDHPPTPHAATAIGIATILDGELDGDRIRCALGTLTATRHKTVTAGPQPCRLLLRPEQLLLNPSPQPDSAPATVSHILYHGHDCLVRLTSDPAGITLTARITGTTTLQPGQRTWLTVTSPVHTWPH